MEFLLIKGELNAKTNLFLFESILCEVFFFSSYSNNIKKFNVENKKTLKKRFDTMVANELVSGVV